MPCGSFFSGLWSKLTSWFSMGRGYRAGPGKKSKDQNGPTKKKAKKEPKELPILFTPKNRPQIKLVHINDVEVDITQVIVEEPNVIGLDDEDFGPLVHNDSGAWTEDDGQDEGFVPCDFHLHSSHSNESLDKIDFSVEQMDQEAASDDSDDADYDPDEGDCEDEHLESSDLEMNDGGALDEDVLKHIFAQETKEELSNMAETQSVVSFVMNSTTHRQVDGNKAELDESPEKWDAEFSAEAQRIPYNYRVKMPEMESGRGQEEKVYESGDSILIGKEEEGKTQTRISLLTAPTKVKYPSWVQVPRNEIQFVQTPKNGLTLSQKEMATLFFNDAFKDFVTRCN